MRREGGTGLGRLAHAGLVVVVLAVVWAAAEVLGDAQTPPGPQVPSPATTEPAILTTSALSERPASDPEHRIINFDTGYFMGRNKTIFTARNRFRVGKRFNMTFEMKPINSSGILAAVHSSRYGDFLLLQMVNGTIIFTVQISNQIIPVKVPIHPHVICNGSWFRIEAVKFPGYIILGVNKNFTEPYNYESESDEILTNKPLYIGGIPNLMALSDYRGLQTIQKFVGCIKNMRIETETTNYTTLLPAPRNQDEECPKTKPATTESGVMPCHHNVNTEYFMGPHKTIFTARDRFRVGKRFNMTFQMKPLNSSGILAAVHSRYGDSLLLQIVNGTIIFTVEISYQIISVEVPFESHVICNGSWFHIEAVKFPGFIILGVNGKFYKPNVYKLVRTTSDEILTDQPLYIGGIRNLMARSDYRGLQTIQKFVGCIKNMRIATEKTNETILFPAPRTQDDVCPTN